MYGKSVRSDMRLGWETFCVLQRVCVSSYPSFTWANLGGLLLFVAVSHSFLVCGLAGSGCQVKMGGCGSSAGLCLTQRYWK